MEEERIAVKLRREIYFFINFYFFASQLRIQFICMW